MARNWRRSLCRVRRRLTDVPFASTTAVLAINSAVNVYVNPARQPAALLLPPWDYLWSVLYGIGGALILLGIASAKPNVEAAGCVAFAGGALVSSLVYAIVLGWHGANTVGLLLLFTGAALVRTYHLATGRVLLLVRSDAVHTLRTIRRG